MSSPDRLSDPPLKRPTFLALWKRRVAKAKRRREYEARTGVVSSKSPRRPLRDYIGLTLTRVKELCVPPVPKARWTPARNDCRALMTEPTSIVVETVAYKPVPLAPVHTATRRHVRDRSITMAFVAPIALGAIFFAGVYLIAIASGVIGVAVDDVSSLWSFEYTTLPEADVSDRIIYVDSAAADNSGDGLTTLTPKKDWWNANGAQTLMRAGFGDRMLLKCGGVWDMTDHGDFRLIGTGGLSSVRPMIFNSYGTGNRPWLKNGYLQVTNGATDCKHVWILGLRITAVAPLVELGGYPAIKFEPQGGEDFLVENCLLENFPANLTADPRDQDPPDEITNIRIRGNVIVDAYSSTGGSHAQGAFFNYSFGVLVEGNVFDHNGYLARPPAPAVAMGDVSVVAASTKFVRVSGSWVADGYVIGDSCISANFNSGDNSGTFTITNVTTTDLTVDPGVRVMVDEVAGALKSVGPPSRATIFNHNMYIHETGGTDGMFLGNIIARASASAIGHVAGERVAFNLFLSNPFGNNLTDRALVTNCDHNFYYDGGNVEGEQNGGIGIPLSFFYGQADGHTVAIHDNVFAHQTSGTEPWAINPGARTDFNPDATINHLSVRDNIFYKWCLAFRPSDGVSQVFEGPDNEYVDNIHVWGSESPFGAAFVLIDKAIDPATLTIAGNRWHSDANPKWQVNGSNLSTSAAWIAASGETGGDYTLATFSNPDRSPSSYAQDVLSLDPTLPAFLDYARGLRQGVLEPNTACKGLHNYLRDGFDLEPI